jgi:hypothetical protein
LVKRIQLHKRIQNRKIAIKRMRIKIEIKNKLEDEYEFFIE